MGLEVGAALVGGAVLGSAMGGKSPKAAEQNTAGFLRQFGFTSPLYDTQIRIDEDQKNFSVTNTGDPRLTSIMNRQLDAVDPLLQLQIQELRRRPANFNYNFILFNLITYNFYKSTFNEINSKR